MSDNCEFTEEPNHSGCACCFKEDGSVCSVCDYHKARGAR